MKSSLPSISLSFLAAWFLAFSARSSPCPEAARRLLENSHRAVPFWGPIKYANFLLRESVKFPDRLFAKSLDKVLDYSIARMQMELVGKLRDVPEFGQLVGERSELITLTIVDSGKIGDVEREVIDEDFLKSWGVGLSDAISERRHLRDTEAVSAGLLQEIVGLLQLPEARISPHSLAQNLAVGIAGLTPQLRAAIADQVKNGKITLLRKHLPQDLSPSGFDPSRLGLKVGETKEYYLSVLQDSLDSNNRLDTLLPSYIFSRNIPEDIPLGDFLASVTEIELDYIRDVHFKKKHIDEIVNSFDQSQRRELKKSLGGRLERIGKYLSRHKKTIIERADEAGAQLTLTEVHPHLAIFRGHLGGDCATTHSFGFANSPLERVFFISNKRGESVGYVNGTTVSLKDGRSAFFINTVAGARVSGMMAEKIFLAFSKVKHALGVEEVVLLGQENTNGNINYSLIRDAYKKSRGGAIQIFFGDEKIREVIKESNYGEYDMPERLKSANFLKTRDMPITVNLETRPFVPEVPVGEGLVLPEIMDEEIAVSILKFLVKNGGTARDLEKLLPHLPDKFDERSVVRLFESALTHKAEPEYLDAIMDFLPVELDGKFASQMFWFALKFRTDTKYLDRVLGHLSKGLDSYHASLMLSDAFCFEKAGLECLDKIVDHLPERLDSQDVFRVLQRALEYRQTDLRYVDKILQHLPENLDSYSAQGIFEILLRYRVDAKYLAKVLDHLPGELDDYYASQMLQSALRRGLGPEFLDKIWNHLSKKSKGNLRDEIVRLPDTDYKKELLQWKKNKR